MPHEVRQLAGHASLETTMKYYVGIRQSMIDRAREASSTAMGQNFVAQLLHGPKNDNFSTKKWRPRQHKPLKPQQLQEVGATGLEPATS